MSSSQDRPDGPRAVAVIPARGGSKGVPGKNLLPVGGVSLVGRAVRACLAAETIAAVYVSTDDHAIAAEARRHGAGVIDRPPELSGDQASSESALLHALDVLGSDGAAAPVLVFVQATSPFIDSTDLDAGVSMVLDDRADTVFAAVPSYDFLWRDDDETIPAGSGTVHGQNHDAAVRPRRQDRRPDFRETGSFYVMSTEGFRRHQHRFFGRIGVVTVSAGLAVDVDTMDDLRLARALADQHDHDRHDHHRGDGELGGPIDVDALVTDFDGVHTPDTAYVDADGGELVRVSRGDGMGVERLRQAGVPMLILSKERHPVVLARARKLGVEVIHGADDKATVLQKWIAEAGLDASRVAYVGNDVNDLGPMGVVGWPVAVPGSHPAVIRAARVVLSASAGAGAVREVCERVLAAHVVTND